MTTVDAVSASVNSNSDSRVYLDAASSCPMHPVAQQAFLASFTDGWADPARLHTEAARARQLLEAARETVAELLNVRASEVTFTTSGSQAARMAINGITPNRQNNGSGKTPPTIVHSAIEHSAVLRAIDTRCANGWQRHEIGVTRTGHIDSDAWEKAVATPETALAVLMSANHEVGTAQPISKAAQACAQNNIPLYVDAGASLGWLPTPEGWSLLSASAHKWGGPTGVGLLVVRGGTQWSSPSASEQGTYKDAAIGIPAIVAAVASLRARIIEQTQQAARLKLLSQHIRQHVLSHIPDVEMLGDPTNSLPHLVAFSCLYLDGETLVHELNRRGFAVASGSACTSDTQRPSHVLTAMGALTHGNVRISLHPGIKEADIERLLAVLPTVVTELRNTQGVNSL